MVPRFCPTSPPAITPECAPPEIVPETDTLLTAPSFYDAYKALPWVALGWAMYGLWVVFLVISGRVKVTRRNFPASIAGLAANIVLLRSMLLFPRDQVTRST